MYSRCKFSAASFLVILSLSSVSAVAIPGDLDGTWATNGKATIAVGTPPTGDLASAITLQSDGKVVIAGQCNGPTNQDFCVARFNTDGTPDTTFNFVGSVVTPIGSLDDRATAVAAQSDGKIVVVGSCIRANTSDMCAVRYMSNGSLDLSFGATGKVILTTPSGSGATSVSLQYDGKILVGGWCGPSIVFCVVRYSADGQIDNSFGSSGQVTVSLGAGVSWLASVIALSDGTIVLSGYCYEGFCVARLDGNGVLDATFGTLGKVVTPIVLNGGRATAAAVFPDGKILVVGYCTSAFFFKFCAAKYNSDGSLDASFASTGVAKPSMVSGHAVANALARLPDGKVLLAGYCYNGANNDICSARLNSDGSLDQTFGSGGWIASTGVQTEEQGNALVLQADGKFLVAGTCSGSMCVTRHTGGPFGYEDCKADLDGDGLVLATTDALILTRIALGLTGPAVMVGIDFPANAKRKTWQLVRTYLNVNCGLRLRD